MALRGLPAPQLPLPFLLFLLCPCRTWLRGEDVLVEMLGEQFPPGPGLARARLPWPTEGLLAPGNRGVNDGAWGFWLWGGEVEEAGGGMGGRLCPRQGWAGLAFLSPGAPGLGFRALCSELGIWGAEELEVWGILALLLAGDGGSHSPAKLQGPWGAEGEGALPGVAAASSLEGEDGLWVQMAE